MYSISSSGPLAIQESISTQQSDQVNPSNLVKFKGLSKLFKSQKRVLKFLMQPTPEEQYFINSITISQCVPHGEDSSGWHKQTQLLKMKATRKAPISTLKIWIKNDKLEAIIQTLHKHIFKYTLFLHAKQSKKYAICGKHWRKHTKQ